jgi:hypothetical protein
MKESFEKVETLDTLDTLDTLERERLEKEVMESVDISILLFIYHLKQVQFLLV